MHSLETLPYLCTMLPLLQPHDLDNRLKEDIGRYVKSAAVVCYGPMIDTADE